MFIAIRFALQCGYGRRRSRRVHSTDKAEHLKISLHYCLRHYASFHFASFICFISASAGGGKKLADDYRWPLPLKAASADGLLSRISISYFQEDIDCQADAGGIAR